MVTQKAQTRSFITRAKQVLTGLLPGIFLIGYNVGTGSITSMSKAGANFGLDLLWALVASCLMTYYLMSLTSRYSLVTRETLIEGFKNRIHPRFAQLVVLCLSLIILSALMGVLGIITDVITTWLQTSSILISCSTALAIYLVLLSGNMDFFQRVLAGLVSIMAVALLTSSLYHFPTMSELLLGLVPKTPETAANSDNNSLVVMAGLVGTTVSVFVLIIRSGLVLQQGWTMSEHKQEKRDAAVSATLMFIISAAVMITAASTLHVQGKQLNNISEMLVMLEPVFGQTAITIFVIGIVAAGISSHFPNLLVIPWIIDDYRGHERNVANKKSRLLLLVLSLISLLGVTFNFKPIFLMLLSQASIALIFPIVLFGLAYLTSRKKLMGQYVINQKDKVILSVIMTFALYMSFQALKGLLDDLVKLV